jgi:hypothetical protein
VLGSVHPPPHAKVKRRELRRKSWGKRGFGRIDPMLVRKGGLEPPWVAPPDPKSGASANFATFAYRGFAAFACCDHDNASEAPPRFSRRGRGRGVRSIRVWWVPRPSGPVAPSGARSCSYLPRSQPAEDRLGNRGDRRLFLQDRAAFLGFQWNKNRGGLIFFIGFLSISVARPCFLLAAPNLILVNREFWICLAGK